MKCCLRLWLFVAVPSRVKVNYHILFLTGHHLLAGERAPTCTCTYSPVPLKYTYGQTIREKVCRFHTRRMMLHVLDFVVSRRLTEAHSFPITVRVTHTYFILERKKESRRKKNPENNNKRSCRISAWIQRAWLALSLHNTSSRT